MTRPATGRPLHARAYLRVSAVMGRSDDSFRSPDLQLDAIRRAASERGHVLDDVVYRDIDRTGRDFHREGIQQAIADRERYDVLWTYDLARFGRNVLDSLREIDRLSQAGVTLASTVEPVDETPEGRLMLTQFLGFAEYFSRQMGRRWKQLIEHRAELGFAHGSAPIGYVKTAGRLIPDPVTAGVVQRVFAGYAAGEVRASLRDELSVARGPTQFRTMKAMLRNPVYAGRVRLNGRELPGGHEPLVDERTWAAVQARLRQDTTVPSRTLGASYPLSGLLLCGECSRRATLTVNHGTVRAHCVIMFDKYRSCPGFGSPAAVRIEDEVLEAIRGIADQVQPAESAEDEARRATAVADLQRVQAEMVKSTDALGRLTEGWARGDLTDRAYQAALPGLEASLSRLQDRLYLLEREASRQPPTVTAALAGDLLEMWDEATVPERNAALRLLIDGIPVYRGPQRGRPVIRWDEDRRRIWR